MNCGFAGIPGQHRSVSDRGTYTGQYQAGGGTVPLPIPWPDDLGGANEETEDGAVHVATRRGGHG